MAKPKLRWGHVNINVSDLDRSVAFYELLGFEVFIPAIPYIGLDRDGGNLDQAAAGALDLPAGVTGRACIMQLGDTFPKIDLTEIAVSERRAPLANRDLGAVRICLGTETLDADFEALRQAGVEFLSTPTRAHRDLASIAVCRDPDGTLIELIELYPEKWADILPRA